MTIMRYIEHAVRVWWLWLLALLVPPSVLVAMTNGQPTQYDATMAIWVEQGTYLELQTTDQWNSPANQQAELFRQLNSTRAFLVRIAEGTPLAVDPNDEDRKDWLEEHFSRRLRVTTRGSQLVEVTYRTTDPPTGIAVLQAYTRVATNYITASTQEQARIAAQFYSAQIPQLEKEWADASAALRDYATRLSAGAGDRVNNERLIDQIELGDLRRREEVARKRYDDAVANLNRVKIQSGAVETFQKRGYRVVDQPYVPTRPVSLRRELLVPVGSALGGLLALSLGATVALVYFDRTLRSRRQLERSLDLPVLGAIPSYRRLRRRADPRRVTAQALSLRPAMAGD